MHRFSSVDEAIEAIADGRVVVVVDAEDRENEGDFVASADKVTAETVHFMISEGRGQLCMPLLPNIAERLRLTLMVPSVDESMPRFAVPLDHRLCRTGISPQERAFTIRKIVDSASGPEEFVRPGHIFPLIARTEGVLGRPGHTEATVDLDRLAGLHSGAGILCEICSRDGKHMATGNELFEVAETFKLPIISIDMLIEYRQRLPVAGFDAAALRV